MQETEISKSHQSRIYLLVILIAIAAATAFSFSGFERHLLRDDAIYIYSGQQMADGIPPYVSIFDHKGPLSPILCGIAVTIGRILGADDVFACRALFFCISILVVIALFPLGKKIFHCTYAATFASMSFLALWGFGVHAASGPRAKTPMLLFEISALYLTITGRWFVAGVCGGLGTLVWQPMIVFPAITFLLSILQSPNGERLKNGTLASVGALSPVFLTMTWFASKNALPHFIDGWIAFNLFHIDRVGANVQGNLINIWKAVWYGYAHSTIAILLGIVGMVLFSTISLSDYKGNLLKWIKKDKNAAVILSFPLPFIWSALDFQGYPDFYPFLPYTALGFGWLLSGSTTLTQGHEVLKKIMCSLIAVSFFAIGSWAYYKTRNSGLADQRQWASEIKSELGVDGALLTVGIPEAMVLLQRRNPNPYVFVINGIDNYIEEKNEGGFDGWIRALEEEKPSIVLLGPTWGKHVPKLRRWLNQNYERSEIGSWQVFKRKVTNS